jgi:hypothetical protein
MIAYIMHVKGDRTIKMAFVAYDCSIVTMIAYIIMHVKGAG